MRIVADTNIIVSGLFWQGPPRRILDATRQRAVQLATSPELLAELARVLNRPKFAQALKQAGLPVDQLLADYARLAHVVETSPLPQPVCRDPSDDAVIACAVAAHAEIIVSGDRDLLELGRYRDIAIQTPVDAIKALS
jgi:putative PIN family toxin of toxin-antitoxin system